MRWSLLLVPVTLVMLVLATGLLGAEYAAARGSLRLPFLGLDHLLAVVALGVWAGRLGGEAPMLLPAAFLLGAALGLAMAMDGVGFLIFVRPVVWASVAVLGLAAAFATPLRIEEAGCLVGLFGIFHGHALGAG